jgi:hypothetical protein
MGSLARWLALPVIRWYPSFMLARSPPTIQTDRSTIASIEPGIEVVFFLAVARTTQCLQIAQIVATA